MIEIAFKDKIFNYKKLDKSNFSIKKNQNINKGMKYFIKYSYDKLIGKLFNNSGGEVIDTVNKEPNINNTNLFFKWAWQDSNLRPTDYESVALTN